MRIEITLTNLDPPEGRAVGGRGPGGFGAEEPIEFVGWLGLLWALQSLTCERVDPPPS